MRNYLKNKMKDRLAYCMEWKNSVDIYLANKEITKKAVMHGIENPRQIEPLLVDAYMARSCLLYTSPSPRDS